MELIAPQACTLPTAEQPLRLAEFTELFRHTVRVEPVTPTSAWIHLSGPDGLAGQVRDLARRESECCSFFRFTVTEDGERVVLGVEVPPERADVLAALLRLAP